MGEPLVVMLTGFLPPAGGRLIHAGEWPEAAGPRAFPGAPGISGPAGYCGLRRDGSPHCAAADLFVLPSPYESFPNVMLEALVAGMARSTVEGRFNTKAAAGRMRAFGRRLPDRR